MFNHSLIKRSLAVGLIIGAAAVPAVAQAMPFGPTDASDGYAVPAASSPVEPSVNVPHVSQTALGPTDASNGYAVPAASSPVTAQPGSSFHWGDAGIGAGGAVVLLGAAALGAGVTRRRRAIAG